VRKRDFDIVFSGLSLGTHAFVYDLNDSFLQLFEYTDHDGLKAQAEVIMVKHNTFLELSFSLKGEINVICDRSGEPFSQKIDNAFNVVVKFGEEYNDTDDETLILPQGEYQLNIAQYLFELVVLAIPLKNIHPDVKSGKIKVDIAPMPEINPEDVEESDPRWDKLKDLLN
jgi:uncharacterized metal-binding protein YceD (DUF177 family)